MLCQECKKKSVCIELCREAEEFVNQDYVPAKSKDNEVICNSNLAEKHCGYKVWDYQKEEYNYRQLKRLIIQLRKEGKSFREIAYHLSCTYQYAEQVSSKFEKESKENKDL